MVQSFEFQGFDDLNHTLVECRLCPRLVSFREQVPARASYINQQYWRRPVPGFGDRNGWLLILGLAPAAHGGNRTGRLFTGDASARFLMKALYEQGFANQPTSESLNDGLILNGAYMTAVVKCVPPKDKPTAAECSNCSRYLYPEMSFLKNLTAVLALGKFAFDAYRRYINYSGGNSRNMIFSHGVRYHIDGFPSLYASYHPSPQNTNTGRLSEQMLSSVLRQVNFDRSARFDA